MDERLSEQLTDLSARAKSAKDAIDIAKTETGEKLAAHKEEARATAAAAIEKISTEIKSMRGTVDKNWSVIRAKIEADIDALITRVTADEHDLEVNHLLIRADESEWDAGFAIDYAVAAIEQAKFAVLDAIEARLKAEDAQHAQA
jgi:hypothetical protein